MDYEDEAKEQAGLKELEEKEKREGRRPGGVWKTNRRDATSHRVLGVRACEKTARSGSIARKKGPNYEPGACVAPCIAVNIQGSCAS